jgi:DNA-binding CsgD family transcriptional regulator
MSVPLSQQSLSELIGSIYDCALDPSRWEQTLTGINDALCCHSSILHLNDLRNDRFLIYRPVGIEPEQQEKQAKYVPEIHAMLNEAFALSPSLTNHSCSRQAETRVLASLLAGRTVAETAMDLGIVLSTAKTHLENIFSKTGVSRQADLMRLGTRLVPPTRSAN